MGKWAARLAEKTAAPPHGGTDKTAKRGLASVLAVGPEGGECDSRTVPTPTATPAVPSLAAVAWTDGDIAAFLARRARLMRWGWPEAEAERLAERLVIRDREADARVSCTDCRHYRPGRCANHAGAGLSTPEVGRDLATQLQRCPGFGQAIRHHDPGGCND